MIVVDTRAGTGACPYTAPPSGRGETMGSLTMDHRTGIRFARRAAWVLCALFMTSVAWAQTKPAVSHWSYVKPVRPPLPEVRDKSRCRNPIDFFVLARLEKEGLHPSPEADRANLIRRISLDLIGLPPSPKEVEAFVNDPDPNAYEKLVDRLLASPHYGERWARPWLDLAR